MRLLIYGVGGVGGFLGAHLQRADFDISYVARGKRFEFLQSKGLIVDSSLEDFRHEKIRVFNAMPENNDFDIIICTVKLYDFDNFISQIKKIGIKNSVILPFQNGIYSEQKITEDFGEKFAYGAVAQISSFVDKSQTIIHKGSLASFFVGHMQNVNQEILQKFCEKSINLKIDIQLKENIKEKIWEKFIFLSAYSGITTLTKKTIGEIFDNHKLKDKFTSAMIETYNLSKNFEVNFKVDPVEYWLHKIKKMPYDLTSSMYIDYKNGSKLELEWLSGFIVKYSNEFDIECKVHEEILKGIKFK